MRYLILAGLIFLVGCNSINNVDKGKTTTIVEHVEFQKDGKTPKSKTTTTTTVKNDKHETDDSFTIGSKGLGSYSILRDISFM